LVLAIGVVSFVAVSFALLAYADFLSAQDSIPQPRARPEWAVRRGDHLHYGVHLMAGRVLDICPCTRNAALTQYQRARFHAVTPRERVVLGAIRPKTPEEWLEYAVGPLDVGLAWLGDAVAWVSQ
jgi:hypothetical protein